VKKANAKTAVILGAGFSFSLGVPAYAEVLKSIAKPLDREKYNLNEFQEKIDIEITKHISQFLLDVFDYNVKIDKEENIPSLEQVFTFIDLSTNVGFDTGYSLGFGYMPDKLNSLRRFLTYKLFLIIDKNVDMSSATFLRNFLEKLSGSNYVSLNWDIVLEKRLIEIGQHFQYGVDEILVESENGIVEQLVEQLSHYPTPETKLTKIAKVHGSSNWAYCGNCHKIFCDMNKKITKNIQTDIFIRDIKNFYESGKSDKGPLKSLKQEIRKKAYMKKCPKCGYSLASHIATFSYSKSFRTHAFALSWKLAEDILADAERWIFIGYSIPKADYIFSHMLKCSQKRDKKPKKIIVIQKGDKAKEDYISLFGKRNIRYFNCGFDNFATNHLDELD